MSKKRPTETVKTMPPDVVSDFRMSSHIDDLQEQLANNLTVEKRLFDFFSMIVLFGVVFNAGVFVLLQIEAKPYNVTLYAVLLFLVVMFFCMSARLHRIVELYAEIKALTVIRKLGLAHQYGKKSSVILLVVLIEMVFFIPFMLGSVELATKIFQASKVPITRIAPTAAK